MTDLGVNFKDACHRLWRVLVSENNTFGGLNPVKCIYCREFTCSQTCIEERRGQKVTIDIGGKITKVIGDDFRQECHLSMMAFPKVLKCYDCDKTFTREEVFETSNRRFPGIYCHNRNFRSHTGLEYRSQALAHISNQPFCLFCDQDSRNQLLYERQIVADMKEKLESVRYQYLPSISEEDFRNQETFLPLTNGYCK